jgi:hypothetical protein
MRKIYLLMALCLSFAITSCGDKNEDEILFVDYAPVEFYISVENKYGVDLLNSENEGALDLDAITLYYDEKTYVLNPKTEPQATRAYMPHFEGMELQKIDGKYRIYVGEFEGCPGYSSNDSFAMEWGDGSRDTFSYTNTKVGQYGVKHNFFLNGHPVKSGAYPYVSITVIK